MPNPLDRDIRFRGAERDACGIGFVADAHGRASHTVVRAALDGLASVVHRGAVAADSRTADGSGVLLAIPPAIFGEGHGVASLFVRSGDPRATFERVAALEDLSVVEWRTPPTDEAALGRQAVDSRPQLLQAVLASSSPNHHERAAFRLRRRLRTELPDTYVASCSFRTVVYKGLVSAAHLGDFYLDLRREDVESTFVVFHQRFSTNTAPTWERAQPFRTLCHNGEINAISGNARRMEARGKLGTEEVGLGPEELFHPVLDARDSDSGQLDSAVELLVRGGRDIRHAIAMLVPEAWEGARDLDPEVRGFYRYHAALMEPWDGPAGLIFTDGLGVGAALDRNGLRPLRYAICEDGLVVCCSEAGAVDVHGHGTVTRGRLGPGQMLFVDPSRGVLFDDDCKLRLAAGAPYARWAADGVCPLPGHRPVEETPDAEEIEARQVAQGWTVEELRMVVRPMAAEAKEPVFSMGDDAPLPFLATRPRPIHHFFRQRFAQVTNPPIDHLRERSVFSLRTLLGPRPPILTETEEAARLVRLSSFFAFPSTVDRLRNETPFNLAEFDATFDVADGASGLRSSLERLAADAVAASEEGAELLIVDNGGVSATRAAIGSVFVTGVIHHALVGAGRRDQVGIVVVGDDIRDTHHVACLLAFGADAICPRLALMTVAADADAADSGLTSPQAQEHFQAAIEDGVLKILSKMGIATVDSYRGAQIVEAIGLGADVVELCFPGVVSTLGGLGFDELGADALLVHEEADLTNPGYYRDLKGGTEHHTHNKEVVDALNAASVARALDDMAAAHLLQKALNGGGDEAYETFAARVNGRPPTELRDLLDLAPAGAPISVDEVEPAASIVQRFSTGAMSHGSLSREAHETLARAMNLIGGKSNCGEGGEEPSRYRTRGLGRDDKNSRIKQIASGRFGVTPEYCAFADELQIKVAQGSKPGEGGQLPGHKVSGEIAKLRHTQPNVTLISPPPHHDIYSIEDLAQLIFDLKQVNSFADVSVKLVAVEGVGTIAAGVVKALADVVQISGFNGGTGASPLSSIKHAGMPWELGLAETQAVLIENHLRSRVRVRVDGGFMTGRDVLVAALLGADEYSFGTAAMIAEGCIMLRACHRDTCNVGVATQRPHLRAKFAGTPEGVASYFMFVAEEVRSLLASLGLRSIDEAVGRVECLTPRADVSARAAAVDLGALITPPEQQDAARRYEAGIALQRPRSDLGDRLNADAYRAVWDGEHVELAYAIANADRSVGAALCGALALEFGEQTPRGVARVRFDGEAGQSFGAFLTDGVHFELVGEANDYVGKAMGGGQIVIRPPADDASLVPGADALGPAPVLAGNTCMYGATGGHLYVAGVAGERFAVRNSGATAVVEGVGDHGCEYMTGGVVVVLGETGHNFGAGMTGGTAYVWDPNGDLPARLNGALVEAMRPDTSELEEVRWLIERHAELTASMRARALLSDWVRTAAHLWYIAPVDQVRRLEAEAASRVGVNA
ncbi:MAG TPA: glutamate synthase large subunit [Acidimicrobiales bacterium]|nr:glutamate synthase large subunit [Acidimicrobiales bacterium]